MSILIRTGSGKTDLSYTDNAVKDLKVLQKTGTKSVQWITTQAGTTDNILQKRGVRDLFYGDITIPSDLPQWQDIPYSGTTPEWSDTISQPEWTEIIWETSSSTEPLSLIRTKKLNVADNNWQYGVVSGTDILTTFNPSKNDKLYVNLYTDSGWNFTNSTTPNIQIAKIFFIDNTNENNKLVMKVNFYLWNYTDNKYDSAEDKQPSEYKIECGIEEIYSNNLTLAYSTTKNYKVGIRTTLE